MVPRADPVVMRLSSSSAGSPVPGGEILVAGGVDASGAPVSTLEWFSSDASTSTGTQELVSSSIEAFVPLGAGGALAVIANVAANVWVISADHGLQPATSIPGSITDVRLFDGADGAPVLWTGDRWLVWQPWAGAFTSLASAIGAGGPTGDPIASPEPGLGVWINGTSVSALRSGTRGPYATTPPLVFTDTTAASFSAYVAPDRLVLSGVPGPLTLDPENGLTLEPGASVFVTDATFASFTLQAQTPTAAPPSIVLRDQTGIETVLDGSVCSFRAGSTLHVERDGDTVSASVDGGPLVACSVAPAPGARVSIGVRGAVTNASVVQSLVVTRTAF